MILAIATVWWAVFTALVAMVPAGIPGLSGGAAGGAVSSWRRRGHGIPCLQPSGGGLDPVAGAGLGERLIFAGVGAGAGITPPLITFILFTTAGAGLSGFAL